MIRSHFDRTNYVEHTDICVGVRVAIKNNNHLPEIWLYNGAIVTIIEIICKDSATGQTINSIVIYITMLWLTFLT